MSELDGSLLSLEQQKLVDSEVSQQEVSLLQGANKRLEQENELLLLHLHQVQEELEHYFLRYREIKLLSDAQVVVQANDAPAVVEEVFIQESFEQGGYRELKWLAKGIHQAGRSINTLHFKLAGYGGGAPALVIRPSGQEEQHVLAWPAAMSDKYGERLFIKPSDFVVDEVQEEVLRDLSTADWLLIQGISQAVLQYLSQGGVQMNDGVLTESAYWSQLAARLYQELVALSVLARFETVNLKEVHVESGYERYWLALTGFVCDGRWYEAYQFKVILKDFNNEDLPQTLGLVFRDLESGASPLHVWPPAQRDSFGSVLIVDFDIASGQPKIGAWQDVWSGDRSFIRGLVSSLSTQWKNLSVEGVSVGERSPDSWQLLLHPLSQVTVDLNSVAASVDEQQSSSFAKENVAFEWQDVSLFENYTVGAYAHLGIRLHDLHWRGQRWEQYDFKLFVKRLSDDLSEAQPGLELRIMESGLAPLIQWPPKDVGYDEYGTYWLVDVDMNPLLLEQDDRGLLMALIDQLPTLLVKLAADNESVTPAWSIWKVLMQHLQQQIKL